MKTLVRLATTFQHPSAITAYPGQHGAFWSKGSILPDHVEGTQRVLVFPEMRSMTHADTPASLQEELFRAADTLFCMSGYDVWRDARIDMCVPWFYAFAGIQALGLPWVRTVFHVPTKKVRIQNDDVVGLMLKHLKVYHPVVMLYSSQLSYLYFTGRYAAFNECYVFANRLNRELYENCGERPIETNPDWEGHLQREDGR